MPPPTPTVDPTDDETLTVERGHFEQVPHELYVHKRRGERNPLAVRPRALTTYLVLSKAGPNGSFPGRRRLADETGLGVRTVDAAVDDLIEAGWLLVTPKLRQGDRGQSSNSWSLLWTPLTSPDDPRLVSHLRAVEAFDARMDELQERNGKSGERSRRTAKWRGLTNRDTLTTDPAQILRPGGADCDRGPAQIAAPLEEDLLEKDLIQKEPNDAGPAAGADGREESDQRWIDYADFLLSQGSTAMDYQPGNIRVLIKALDGRPTLHDARAWLVAGLRNEPDYDARGRWVRSLWLSDVEQRDPDDDFEVWCQVVDECDPDANDRAMLRDAYETLQEKGVSIPGMYAQGVLDRSYDSPGAITELVARALSGSDDA